MMDARERWRDYPCEEYVRDGWADRGHFDELSQNWVIHPLTETYEDTKVGFFAVGRSGCDGFDFGYRKGLAGLWAFYPIDREFKFMATTIVELIDGWCSNRLSV